MMEMSASPEPQVSAVERLVRSLPIPAIRLGRHGTWTGVQSERAEATFGPLEPGQLVWRAAARHPRRAESLRGPRVPRGGSAAVETRRLESLARHFDRLARSLAAHLLLNENSGGAVRRSSTRRRPRPAAKRPPATTG
jgi:hypothetical protein